MAELQRVCVSATGEPRYEPPFDEEAWIAVDMDDERMQAVVSRFVDTFHVYLGADRGIAPRTLHLETWPQVLEYYKRDGLIS